MYHIFFFDPVNDFLKGLPETERAKILATTDTMKSGNFHSLRVKTLKTPIKELIIKQYRFIFFINENIIHFVGAFIKKSAKTPRKEIQRAERIYKLVRQAK